MSRRARNPFTKVSNFFKRRFDSPQSTPNSSNVDNSSGGLPSTLLVQATMLSSPHSPSPPIPSASTRFPAAPPPSPPVILPPGVPPHPPQPLQLPHHPANHVPSYLASSSSSHYTASPANPLLQPPTLGLIPCSSLPSASSTPTPQFGESTSFAGAHDFNLYHPQFNELSLHNPQFNDFTLAGSGIDKLLKNSMPDAFHNSAARYPPPKCHLGTRTDYITQITDWGLGNSDHLEPVLWMYGPFGIGKSAVAQSCAEALKLKNKLAATLFFSRSNAGRDDPRRVFTSIAYQISTICEPFSHIVDTHIRKDPAIATKSLSAQFEELLVHPLRQIDNLRSGIEGRIVIIDGLDECRGSPEQCEIINVIAASARDRTTPFRWFITSRPEDPIIRTMNSDTVLPISFHLELPVSRKVDHEILVYLTDEFGKIRKQYRLAESWPSEEVLALLVERTAGLWIYVTTITRFITDESGFGPEDQLRIVLAFLKDVSAKDNPLTEMDFFYVLIIQRIPLKIRTIVRKMLLLSSFGSLQEAAVALGLSEDQLRRSCASIQSVLELQGSNFERMQLHFYHASFLDFMKDPKRSKELSIHGDFLTEYRWECLDWLHQVCLCSTGPSQLVFPSEPVLPEGWGRNRYYSINLAFFWDLCSVPNHPLDPRTATSLEKLQFRPMLQLTANDTQHLIPDALTRIRDNLPTELRDKIIREDRCPTPGCTNSKKVWIFGHGENVTVAAYDGIGLTLTNNQSPNPGWCFCGSQIEAGNNNREER